MKKILIGADESSRYLYGAQFEGYLIVKRPFLSLKVFQCTSVDAPIGIALRFRPMTIRISTTKILCATTLGLILKRLISFTDYVKTRHH